VKNAKTGEIIKTEIVRIDSNGETTVTSYPAGTPVPSLGSLQATGCGFLWLPFNCCLKL